MTPAVHGDVLVHVATGMAPPSGADQPMLETERLMLRPPKATDYEGYRDFIMSERAEFVGRETGPMDAWKTFMAEAGHWHLHGFGPWAVTLKGTDRSLGHVGVWQPAPFPEREIGWLLWEEAEGKGIAYEAAVAARDHDFRTFGPVALVSYIAAGNTRSIRLAERLGARLDPDAAAPFADTLVYRHPLPRGVSP